MREHIIFGVLFLALLISSGCVQSPAEVAQKTPGVLANISNDISTMETPNITLESALQPLRTSADYVRPIILPTPTVQQQHADPIVGNWQYLGDPKYQCYASFSSDLKASASCSSAGNLLIQRSFVWKTERNIYPWMRNYTIMDISDNRDYSVAYSEHTGRLTSEIMPGAGYLVKVG